MIGIALLVAPYVGGQKLSTFSLTAASGHPADVQAAVDQVLAAGGGTVNIPAGDWQFDQANVPNWAVHFDGGAVSIDLETLPPGGWLNIIGSSYNVTTTTNTGQTITCPATILRSTVGTPTSGSIATFCITGSKWTLNNQDYMLSRNKHIRISGITILGKVTNDAGSNNNGISLSYVDGFLIDHCTIDSNIGCDIGLSGSKGVISHCQILQTYHLNLGGVWGYGVIVGGNYGLWGSGFGTPTWINDMNDFIGKYDWQGINMAYSNPQVYYYDRMYGGNHSNPTVYTTNIPYSAGPYYIEDNYFSYCRHAVASNGYGYYVARYNLFNYSLTGMPLPYLDVHGSPSPSGRGYEAYGNIFMNNPVYGVDYSGGGGAVFNNTFVGPCQQAILLANGGYSATQVPVDPQYVRDLWIWSNTYANVQYKIDAWTSQGITSSSFYSDVEAVDYNNGFALLSGTPTAIQPPRPNYVPYQYPHPLAVSGGLTTATTEQTTTLTTQTTQSQTTQISTVPTTTTQSTTTRTTQATSTSTMTQTTQTVTQTTSYQTTVTQIIPGQGVSPWYLVQGIGVVFLVAGAYSGYADRKVDSKPAKPAKRRR